MSEITLEWIDQQIKCKQIEIHDSKEPAHIANTTRELEVLVLARQALSQGDVVWEGMMHCIVDQDVAMINDIPAHQLFECNTGDFDRIAHETGLKGQDVHVTIRRAQ